MSYMRPAFAKLEDFDTEHTRFASKYSVYLYREVMVDEDTRVDMPQDGLKLLLIVGRSKVSRYFSSLETPAATNRCDQLLPKLRHTSTMFSDTTMLP